MYKWVSGFIILIGMLLEIVLHSIVPGLQNNLFFIPIILLSFVFICLGVTRQYTGRMRQYIFVAILVRFLIMWWNVFGRDIYCLPGVGTDTEGFFDSASQLAGDLSLLKTAIYGGYYAKYLGLLYYFTGPSYLFGSYLNFLYGLIALSYVNKITERIAGLPPKNKRIAVLIYAFEPTNMIISSSLRRESLMVMFVVLSVYMMFMWTQRQKTLDWVLAFVFILSASVLHAGVIGIAAGYLVLLLFYNPKMGKWILRRDSIFMAIVIVVGIAVIFTRYKSLFLSKLLVDNQETLFRRVTRAVGGASYLKNLRISSVRDLILYMPIKAFYFLLAPMPWNWRGIADALAFAMDSVFYVFLFKYLFMPLARARKAPVTFAFALSLWGGLLIYAAGSSNAANAMRHRYKLLCIMVVLYCLIKAEKARADQSATGQGNECK